MRTSLYDVDFEVEDSAHGIGKLHDYEFNRESRRMICAKCGAFMSEAPEYCSGKRPNISQ